MDEKIIVRQMLPDDKVVRPVEQVSLGPHLVGAAHPHPDTSDAHSLEQGVRSRIGRQMPAREPTFLGRLAEHTRAAIKYYNLRPIDADYPFLFEDWLSSTNYEEWRKAELRAIHEDIVDMLERNDKNELKYFRVKLFMKHETYPLFKNPRGIYAREDVAKVYFGPYFKAIENLIYYNPETGTGIKHFIKHVPVDKRPDFIMEEVFMEAFRSVCTDYTALEAHFDKGLFENCEFVLYDHMLGANPHGREALKIMREVLMGANRVMSKYLSCVIVARRMSGEMNTSLGNGWTNLMLFTYWAAQNGIPFSAVRGVIEGDDGLFCIPPDIKIPTEDDFARWGLLIKICTVDDICRASFCGMIFDPIERCIISDPFKILANFGYTTKRYAGSKQSKLRSLLRAKAMSMMVQYYGCPIISTLARKMLELTRSYDVRHVISTERSEWYRNKLIYGMKNYKQYVDCKPGDRTRALFEELYGIPVSVQLSIEARIDAMTTIEPLCFPELIPLFPKDCVDYFEKYNCVYDVKNRFVIFDCPKVT